MAQINTDLIPVINESFQLDLPDSISYESLKEKLSSHINLLIESDFTRLVSILYRIDISEAKLKQLLKVNAGINAADIIVELIIERQLEKIKSRQQFNKRDENIRDDEKW
jgi:hypothetical protein